MAVVFLLSFTLTPLLLRELGAERYGAFRSLQDFMSYFSLLELGAFGGLLSLMNRYLSRGEDTRLAGVFSSSGRVFSRLTALGLLLALILYPLARHLVPVSAELLDEFRITYALFAGTLIFTLTRPHQALIQSAQLGYIANIAQTGSSILFYLTAVSLVLAGVGLPALGAGTLAGALVASGAQVLAVRRRFGGRLRKKGTFSLERLKFLRFQLPYFLIQLTGRISLFSDNLIISFVLAPRYVASFFLTQRFIQIVFEIIQGITNSTWARMGEIYHAGDKEKFERTLDLLVRSLSFLSASTLAALCAVNPVLIRLWVGEDIYAGDALTAIVGLNTFFQPILSAWGWCFSTIGAAGTLVPVLSVTALVNISLSVFLTVQWGIVGPAAGTLVTYLTLSLIWMSLRTSAQFGLRWTRLHRSWLPFFLSFAALYAAESHLVRKLNLSEWPELILAGAGFGAVNLLVNWIILGSDARSYFLDQFRRIRNARRGDAR